MDRVVDYAKDSYGETCKSRRELFNLVSGKPKFIGRTVQFLSKNPEGQSAVIQNFIKNKEGTKGIVFENETGTFTLLEPSGVYGDSESYNVCMDESCTIMGGISRKRKTKRSRKKNKNNKKRKTYRKRK